MLKFQCPHCGVEKEYNRSNLNQLQRDTAEIKGHVVCNGCNEEYKDINRLVQEFADQKRKELEEEFFNVKPVDIDKQLDKLVEEDESKKDKK